MGPMENGRKQHGIRGSKDITRFGISHNRAIPNPSILPLGNSPTSTRRAWVSQASSPASAGGVPPPVPTVENTTCNSLQHNQLRKVPSYSNPCGEGVYLVPIRLPEPLAKENPQKLPHEPVSIPFRLRHTRPYPLIQKSKNPLTPSSTQSCSFALNRAIKNRFVYQQPMKGRS
jgi:hypothetical protein